MKEQTLQIGDQKLYYKEYTNSETKGNIMILHGWWGKSDSWENVANILQKNKYNVYIPDLPGFWKSPLKKSYTLDSYTNLIHDFISELDLDIDLLLWHSNWGAISSKIAASNKSGIKKLILNNSAGVRTNLKRRIKRVILKPIALVFKALSFLPFYKIMRENLYKLIGSRDFIKAETENWFLKSTYLNIISNDLTSTFQKIKIPTLLIWGAKDTMTPLSDGNHIRLNIKASDMIILDNEQHSIHLKNPLELSKHILAYIRK